jgi:hypothetical protein
MPGKSCPVTTSSGKPPADEHSIDSSWGSSAESSEMLEPGAGFEAAAMAGASDEDEPVYGVGVPYGGNEHTEEVEPIALDVPFSAEDVMTPPVVTPAIATQPRPFTSRPRRAVS